MAAVLGLAWGDWAWGVSLQAPAFAWPELSRAAFWGLGALAGMAFAGLGMVWLVWALARPWAQAWSQALLSLGWAPLAALWPRAAHVRLPYPHDLPLRPLQILGAAAVLLPFFTLALLGLRAAARQPETLGPPRRAALRLAALAWCLSLIFGTWSASWWVTGDAPHYMMMADSIALDGDTDMTNNYARGDWRTFYQYREPLVSDCPTVNGHIRSWHLPGVPVLLALPYRFLRDTGARWGLAGLAALGGAWLYLLLLAAGHSRRMALLGWAALSFSPAWLTQSQMMLGELAGGVCLLAAWGAWRRVLPWAWAWVGPGFLLWLNIRYYPAAAGLALLALVATPGRRRWAGLALLAALVAGIAWLNQLQYGTVDPFAPLRDGSGTVDRMVQLALLPKVVCGLLLDQEYGFLFYQPAFALAALGAWAWWRRDRLEALVVGAAALALVGPVLTFPGWWGDVAPARYMVCITPVFAYLCAEAFRAWGPRPAFKALLALNLAWALAFIILPWLAFSKRDGSNLILKLALRPLGADLTHCFPSLIIPNTAAWLWALGLACGLVLAVRKLGPPR